MILRCRSVVNTSPIEKVGDVGGEAKVCELSAGYANPRVRAEVSSHGKVCGGGRCILGSTTIVWEP